MENRKGRAAHAASTETAASELLESTQDLKRCLNAEVTVRS
jgi:hypothetical protein